MATPLAGTETVTVETASGSTIASAASNSRAVALLGAAIPARINTAIPTAGNGVLSAAGLVGSIITRTGATGAFSDTTDTAANIIAALPAEAPINTAWPVWIKNTTPFPQAIVGGVGVTVAGGGVVPANSTGVFEVIYTGAGSVTLQNLAVTPTDLGIIEVNTAVTTAGAGTLGAAAIVGGMITRTGATAAFIDTSDTAANIIAALPNASVGQSWELSIVNQTAFAQTLAGGTGVTVSGLAAPIPANSFARALCTYSAAGAVTIYVAEIHYNAAGGRDPATKQTGFGGGAGNIQAEGKLYREVDAVAVNPGGTGSFYVLSVFSLPAGSFDQALRGLHVTAKGSFAANGNTKEVQIVWNPATAVVGSVVGTGGTVVADTGALTTSGGGWQLEGEIFKYGAAGSNTQICTSGGAMDGSGHHGTGGAPALATAVESGAILVAIVGKPTTTATDIALSQVTIDGFN